ncbi:hypothetical protein MUCCIDRAFT_155003, partial [Mucor lusitanicus CBS 277.49]
MASANSESTKGKASPKTHAATSSESVHARQQSQSSPLISNTQQQQQQAPKVIQLTDESSRLSRGSVNQGLHYNPDLRGLSAPTYMANWTPTSQPQNSNQSDQAMLQLGSNTNPDSMVYLDNRYRYSAHTRSDSNNNSSSSSSLPQHSGFDHQPPSNSTAGQLWPSSHHRQTSSSLDQQFGLNNRNEANDVLSYNNG